MLSTCKDHLIKMEGKVWLSSKRSMIHQMRTVSSSCTFTIESKISAIVGNILINQAVTILYDLLTVQPLTCLIC